jgi:hypothetical protein
VGLARAARRPEQPVRRAGPQRQRQCPVPRKLG